ncbi:MAG: MFS transporter [Planctomycetota bacterium]
MTNNPQSSQESLQTAQTPLWAVLTITALGTWGTAIGWSAVYFLAEKQFGLTSAQNAWLGLVGGVGYTLVCLASSRLTSLLGRVGLSHRLILMLTLCLMGITSGFPPLVGEPWALWFFMATFVPLQGLLWPITESFLSGGRRGRRLRHATGGFNISWSVAAVLAMWFVAATIEIDPDWSFYSLAVAQVLMLLVIAIGFPLDPAPHLDDHEPKNGDRADHDRERRLLLSFRGLNLLSYIMIAALSPLLPALMGRLGLEGGAKPLVNSAWMITRVIVFTAMQFWHGWHGRWRTVIWSFACIVAGICVAFLSPSITVMVLGLATFGVGAGGVSCAAIYYAMEVGSAEVDAGGKHEAITGLGYTIGPLLARLIAPDAPPVDGKPVELK